MVKVILPPAAALEAAAAELISSAQDVKRHATINKGLYDLLTVEPAIVRISGAFLVPSSSRGGLVHRVDDVNGCSCEAGRSGRTCRHAAALELVEAAQKRTMPVLISAERAAKLAAAEQARAALLECWA